MNDESYNNNKRFVSTKTLDNFIYSFSDNQLQTLSFLL